MLKCNGSQEQFFSSPNVFLLINCLGIAFLPHLFPDGRLLITYLRLVFSYLLTSKPAVGLALNKILSLSLVPSPTETIQQSLATDFTVSHRLLVRSVTYTALLSCLGIFFCFSHDIQKLILEKAISMR